MGTRLGVGDSRWFELRLLFEPKLPLTLVDGTCSVTLALTLVTRGVGVLEGCD
jgi:hypothetical protein